MNRNFALIIGVHDYRTYDPTGASDVPGALRDARALTRECLAMGFSPERIRVLTSPRLPPGELGPVATGEATRAGIEEGLLWLAGALGEGAPTSGLLTFSGHGAQGDDGMPLLCPSDTTASLAEVIDVGALREMASPEVRARLTALLDCCHAQAGASAAESLEARLRATKQGASAPEAPRARVIAACRRDQVSVSARFVGEVMGAFTWAVTSTMGQWSAIVEGGVARLDASYGDLVTRARALLSALSFEQEPILSGPAGVAALPFLDPRTEAQREETSREPTATRGGRQLDGGQRQGYYNKYQIELDTEAGGLVVLCQIYATASSMGENPPAIGGVVMEPDTEYWIVEGSAVDQLKSARSIFIAWQGELNASRRLGDTEAVYTAEEQTDWKDIEAANLPPTGAITFWAQAGTVRGIGFEMDDTVIRTAWWHQTGKANLTPEDLNNVNLYADGSPSGDTMASSRLAPQGG